MPGDKLTFTSPNMEAFVMATKSENKGKFRFMFKARDLFEVVHRLRNQEAEKFVLQGDDTGLWQISWEDRLGEYDLYVPTVTDEGALNPTHFVKAA